MLKFILPATILLSLMISSQALACRPAPASYCMISVVYQGSSTDFNGRINAKREIVEDRAKADACKQLCEGKETCVLGCVAKAKFPIFRCEALNGCLGWPGGMVPMKEQEDTARARLCGELCEGKDDCMAECMARFSNIGSERGNLCRGE